MSTQQHDLPATYPDIKVLAESSDFNFLPFALYNLTDVEHARLVELAKTLDGKSALDDHGYEALEDTIHLVVAADKRNVRQPSLTAALGHHVEYCKSRSEEDQKGYYPYGFLAVDDENWEANGLWLVYVDFEEPFGVTAFRVMNRDVEGCCFPLREDDVSIEECKEQYAIKHRGVVGAVGSGLSL